MVALKAEVWCYGGVAVWVLVMVLVIVALAVMVVGCC